MRHRSILTNLSVTSVLARGIHDARGVRRGSQVAIAEQPINFAMSGKMPGGFRSMKHPGARRARVKLSNIEAQRRNGVAKSEWGNRSNCEIC